MQKLNRVPNNNCTCQQRPLSPANYSVCCLCLVLGHQLQQLVKVGSHKGVHACTVLPHLESGHGCDVALLGDLLSSVNVDLQKLHDVAVLLGQLGELGCNHLAGSTPVSVEVHKDSLAASCGKSLVPSSGALNQLDHGC
mmetsp:Transcript_21827/g.21573  ORF Transcript_21827/g.21573 Transcript_21827/m.21573 type:complete len:139 (-) Transcript_21827:28-444(-)